MEWICFDNCRAKLEEKGIQNRQLILCVADVFSDGGKPVFPSFPFLTKKWGISIKKESESLDFTGLKIPRDYELVLEDL